MASGRGVYIILGQAGRGRCVSAITASGAALWAIKALRDEPLPLFAAAAAKKPEIFSELNETAVALKSMTSGSQVVEAYAHVGLSLRAHPVSFLRQDLRQRRIVTCAEAMDARDGK